MKNENNYSYINKSYLLILTILIVVITSLIVGLSVINNKITQDKYNQIRQVLEQDESGKKELVSLVNKYYGEDIEFVGEKELVREDIEVSKDKYTEKLHNQEIRLNSADLIFLTPNKRIFSGLEKYPESHYLLGNLRITSENLEDAIGGKGDYKDVQGATVYTKKNYIYNVIYLGKLNDENKLFLLTSYKK